MSDREKVLVTGGLGLLGRYVVDDLVVHGYDVVIVDRSAPGEDLPQHVHYLQADCADVGQMSGALRGCGGLVHLAAYPAPYRHPDEVLFHDNTMATFAVLQAAALMGIRRVALASSGSIYGTAWSPEPTTFGYVPVDEDHPMLNQDAYGLSKEVGERIAEMFCRREQMSIAALRFHWLLTREGQLTQIAERRRGPDFLHEARNLWGYLDLRDAARACRLALEVAKKQPYGFQPMNLVAADTLAEEPIEELLARWAPQIELRSPVSGSTGLYSTARAKEILGWEPEYSWRRIG